MPVVPNLFSGVGTVAPEEQFHTLWQTPSLRVERIVSYGQASPQGFWYDQPGDEWVLLVCGSARLRFEGEAPFEMAAGDYVHIPARRRHRVEWTDNSGPTVWLAVHLPPTPSPR